MRVDVVPYLLHNYGQDQPRIDLGRGRHLDDGIPDSSLDGTGFDQRHGSLLVQIKHCREAHPVLEWWEVGSRSAEAVVIFWILVPGCAVGQRGAIPVQPVTGDRCTIHIAGPAPATACAHIVEIRSDDAAPSARVVAFLCGGNSVLEHNVADRLDVGAVKIHRASRRQDANGVRLAVPVTPTVVVEERPDAASIEEQVGRAPDALKERHTASCIVGIAVAIVRVAGDQVRGPWRRGQIGTAPALPVGGFALLEGGEDVLGVLEVVLVEGVVFHGRSDEPGALGGFDEETTAGGDGGCAAVAVQVVVCGPSPHVLDIRRGGTGQMEQAPGGFALVGTAIAVGLDFGADCTADTEMRVPESHVARSGTGNVYLDLSTS